MQQNCGSQDSINADVIPSSAVKMGLGDALTCSGLSAVLLFPGTGMNWTLYKDPGSVVFRLTPKVTMRRNHFPFRTACTRYRKRVGLVAAVENATSYPYPIPKFQATEVPTFVALPEGFTATEQINTLGDNR